LYDNILHEVISNGLGKGIGSESTVFHTIGMDEFLTIPRIVLFADIEVVTQSYCIPFKLYGFKRVGRFSIPSFHIHGNELDRLTILPVTETNSDGGFVGGLP